MKKNKVNKRLKAAEDALLQIMADEELADHVSESIRRRIDKWYRIFAKETK
jgi:hypothetical protein